MTKNQDTDAQKLPLIRINSGRADDWLGASLLEALDNAAREDSATISPRVRSMDLDDPASGDAANRTTPANTPGHRRSRSLGASPPTAVSVPSRSFQWQEELVDDQLQLLQDMSLDKAKSSLKRFHFLLASRERSRALSRNSHFDGESVPPSRPRSLSSLRAMSVDMESTDPPGTAAERSYFGGNVRHGHSIAERSQSAHAPYRQRWRSRILDDDYLSDWLVVSHDMPYHDSASDSRISGEELSYINHGTRDADSTN